ncbi:peptidase S8 and S53 [Xylaria grammica]|nr:peptidase S8 and S53 [Xylaria grammica]
MALLDDVREGNIDEVRRSLDTGSDPDTKYEDGSTLLHVASKTENHELVKLLLEYGAYPDTPDDSGSTALHYAQHEEVVQLLLDYGANVQARDNKNNTPLHLAAISGAVGIGQLLCGESSPETRGKVPIAESVQRQEPRFPIIINGNIFDNATKAALGSFHTRYLLIQTKSRINTSHREDLGQRNIQVLEYVSENTYLCFTNLEYNHETINSRQDEFEYIGLYPRELKFSTRLEELDKDVEVDIIFHSNVKVQGELSLQDKVAESSKVDKQNIKFSRQKARLTVRGSCISQIALIDEVRRIEEVPSVGIQNDQALGLLNLPSVAAATHNVYQGKGQVIAIADTGLDSGDANNVHVAFRGRVDAVEHFNGFTADFVGHGTHVSGSAVGDAMMGNIRVTGTAPQAHLVMQSIYDEEQGRWTIRPPNDLTELFRGPYEEHNARVHSNSWACNKTTNGWLGYNIGAEEVDNFVWDNPDMVICFAAGNNAEYDANGTICEGQICAQALAKNCITVGASENERPVQDYGEVRYHSIQNTDHSQFPNDIGARHIAAHRSYVAAFSSRGQNASIRGCKPDLVAPGTYILSASSRARVPALPRHQQSGDPHWHYDSGTSMATPLVAGCAAVLREALLDEHVEPSAHLIKALLVNGAERMFIPTTPNEFLSIQRPNIHAGLGRVDIAPSLAVASGALGTGMCQSSIGIRGSSILRYSILAPRDRCTLRATLAWSDPPGEALRNHLILEISCGNRWRRTKNDTNIQRVILEGITTDHHIPRELRTREMSYDATLIYETPPEGASDGYVGLCVRVKGQLDVSPQPFAVVWQFLAG